MQCRFVARIIVVLKTMITSNKIYVQQIQFIKVEIIYYNSTFHVH